MRTMMALKARTVECAGRILQLFANIIKSGMFIRADLTFWRCREEMLEEVARPMSDPNAGFQLVCTRNGVGLKALVLFLHKIVTECDFQRIEILRIVEPTTSSSGSRKPLKSSRFICMPESFCTLFISHYFRFQLWKFSWCKASEGRERGKSGNCFDNKLHFYVEIIELSYELKRIRSSCFHRGRMSVNLTSE